MKSHSQLLIACLLAAPLLQAHAQSPSRTCIGHLLLATEANEKPRLETALKDFESSGCVKTPTSQQLSDGSVDGLVYLLYSQSKKRARNYEMHSTIDLSKFSGGGAGLGSVGSSASSKSGASAHIGPKSEALIKDK